MLIPNPHCKKCRGTNVDVKTRKHMACPSCWPEDPKRPTNKTSYMAGRMKRLERFKSKSLSNEQDYDADKTLTPEARREEDE